MNKEDKKLIAFQLPVSMYEALCSIADKHFRSVSAELRVIVSTYIDSNKDYISEEMLDEKLLGNIS